mmetsp:Transcript_106750/g.212000  ORF Transcript_106750/g.212000 Transcript_106750/m.212000 type:complete len:203 (+) Transcript_106750:210-818(+)
MHLQRSLHASGKLRRQLALLLAQDPQRRLVGQVGLEYPGFPQAHGYQPCLCSPVCQVVPVAHQALYRHPFQVVQVSHGVQVVQDLTRCGAGGGRGRGAGVPMVSSKSPCLCLCLLEARQFLFPAGPLPQHHSSQQPCAWALVDHVMPCAWALLAHVMPSGAMGMMPVLKFRLISPEPPFLLRGAVPLCPGGAWLQMCVSCGG